MAGREIGSKIGPLSFTNVLGAMDDHLFTYTPVKNI